jgi:translation elongation factor P/translation initiation factor 5A
MMALIPWELIYGAVGAVVALVAAWITGKRNGAVRAEIKALKDGAKAERQRNETDKRIAIERDALNRLRRDWTRK